MSEPKKKRGRTYLGHVQYKRNIHPSFKKHLDECLEKLKSDLFNKQTKKI